MTTAEAHATRTIVMAPGADLAEDVAEALTQLRDRQEARLLARQRTAMAVRHATQVPLSPPDDCSAPPPLDLSGVRH
jgi:hypothetical protein